MRGDGFTVRRYTAANEESWIRCRALAFLRTSYFDDVVTSKPTYDVPSVELVAVIGDQVVGIIDIAIRGTLATIETIATHPDHARQGIARALLTDTLSNLPRGVETLDAWTRDDAAANGWYRASGFRETFRYLHVYAKTDAEVESAIVAPRAGLTPVAAFFHARIDEEERLRREYQRVYVCRRYERAL